MKNYNANPKAFAVILHSAPKGHIQVDSWGKE